MFISGEISGTLCDIVLGLNKGTEISAFFVKMSDFQGNRTTAY